MERKLFTLEVSFLERTTILFVPTDGIERKTFEELSAEGWIVDHTYKFDEGLHYYGSQSRSGTHFAICHREETFNQ